MSDFGTLTRFSLDVYIRGGTQIRHWFHWFSLMLERRVTRGLSLTAQCLVVTCTPPAALFCKGMKSSFKY